MTILFDILRGRRRPWAAPSGKPALPLPPRGGRSRIMWIGCTDHQPAPELLLGREDVELITHRNLANQVCREDGSIRSTMEYAVKVWNVDCVVVCGHYDCTGIKLALRASADPMDHVDHWVRPLRELMRRRQAELMGEPDFRRRLDRLAELNVRDQVRAIRRLAAAMDRPKLPVLGWMYDVSNGSLSDCLGE